MTTFSICPCGKKYIIKTQPTQDNQDKKNISVF